jgi:hypothetical protein
VSRASGGTPGALAGRAGCRAHWRGAAFWARQAQALEHPAHGSHANAYAPLIGDTGAQLLSREISVLAHQLPYQCVGGRIQARPLAASVGFWRDVPGRAVTAYALLDKRETDAKEISESTLRAEPALARVKELLP